MENILFDFSKTNGFIKPMNAVNNGPTNPGVRKTKTNFEAYKAAKIPFARNHDASFYTPYGGEHIVDVHRIFKNFDANENDPESYIFEPTDDYLKITMDAGTKVFYRLGAAIEHRYKYGTRVPKDFAKWARICEHIIMHYTEDWANGFHYDIEYWEIWNEPDCHNADGSNPCWQGTEEQFIDFFEVAAKYLKNRFPHLKIGGPAFCRTWATDFKKDFLKAVEERDIPMDFFSYHWYGKHLEDLIDGIHINQEELARVGRAGTFTILNEWNYVRGWQGDIWDYSLATEKNVKGASFIAGAMCAAQANPLDMLMYYDARPCGMNGLFEHETFKPLKPYYIFLMFSELKEMGEYVKPEHDIKSIFTCAAKGENTAGMMLTYFHDNDDGFHEDMPLAEPKKDVCLDIVNPFPGKDVKVQYFVLDEEHSNELVKEETCAGDSFKLNLELPLYSTYYIKLIQA
ncbi:MAG: hypothetical protein II997_05540 [Clostridia bacterium]|nr:hypothetical protein [Clostridia bacterium]